MKYFVYNWKGLGEEQRHIAVTNEKRGDDFILSFDVENANESVTSRAVSELVASGERLENANIFILVD